MPIDTALVGALHVEYMREQDLGGDEHLHHTLFQTSTVDALLEGKYEGDVSFAELGGPWRLRPGHVRRSRRRDDLPGRRLLPGKSDGWPTLSTEMPGPPSPW